MSKKSINIKLEENRINEIKNVASIFKMTITDVFNNALDAYLAKMMKDPFYRLTANVEQATTEESQEILDELNNMSNDDLSIASIHQHTI